MSSALTAALKRKASAQPMKAAPKKAEQPQPKPGQKPQNVSFIKVLKRMRKS